MWAGTGVHQYHTRCLGSSNKGLHSKGKGRCALALGDCGSLGNLIIKDINVAERNHISTQPHISRETKKERERV